jgi:hypothetical protein
VPNVVDRPCFITIIAERPNAATLAPQNREQGTLQEQKGDEVTRMCGGGWKSGITMARSRGKPRDTQRGNSSRSSTGLLATSQRLEKEYIYIESKEGKQIRMGTKRQ